MVSMMKVCVVGAGASGIVSAIKAREKGYDTVILERNNRCGKKLLLTGNGRCNLYNSDMKLDYFHSSNMKELEVIFNKKSKEVIDFFKSLGLVIKDINGYLYPFSKESKSVLSLLMKRMESLGVKVNYDTFVTGIKKHGDNKVKVMTDKGDYVFDKVIISTGGKVLEKTGSDGNGYDLVKSLGHSLTPILPSLVQLEGSGDFYKAWAGVRSEVRLTLYEDDSLVKSESGEVQLTDYGISGICTFNLSGVVSRGLYKGKSEVIYINFVPWFGGSVSDFKDYLSKKLEELNVDLKVLLNGFLSEKLVNLFFKLLKGDHDLMHVADMIMQFKFQVVRTKGFNDGQVCSGGVPLNEINPETMESLKFKNVYLTGEILDVDGICGGYNLGFAWMSGLIAGESV